MTATQEAAPLEAAIDIAATPQRVWSLVSDPRNTARWSPQVVRSVVLGREVRRGTRFANLNRRGPVFWPTTAKIVRLDAERQIAWRITENRTIWSFRLEPGADGGTRLTAGRETPEGISKLSTLMTNAALGKVETFTEELREGLQQTLAAVKAEAEA